MGEYSRFGLWLQIGLGPSSATAVLMYHCGEVGLRGEVKVHRSEVKVHWGGAKVLRGEVKVLE